MTKRRHPFSASQLGFSFDAPTPATLPADLAGLERMVAAGVAMALKGDLRSRDEVAGAVSSLLDTPVSKLMLDGYASEARDGVNMSAGRFLALIAATQRYDILDGLLRRIGAAVLIGDQIHTAQIGSIEQQIAALKRQLGALKERAPIISGGSE
jgi:hypothetical protein